MIPPQAVAALGIAAVAFGAGWTVNGWRAEGDLAKLKAEHAATLTRASETARAEIERVRAREATLLGNTEKIVNEARGIVETLERSVAASDTAGRGLLDAARRAAGRCAAGPGAATPVGGAGAKVPGGLPDGDRLLLVLGELQGAAGAYAEDSGRARAARDVCQQQYEAVRAGR